MTKILLVDNHTLVRTGIRLLLQDALSIDEIGEAPNGEDAVHLARDMKPDIVIMDITMPGIGGLEASMRLLRNHRNLKILIISAHSDKYLPSRLIGLGAAGFLTKNASAEQLLQAIKALQEGNRYIDPSMLDHILLPRFSPAKASPFAELSERELQVLLMTARGIDTDEIAKKLFLSTKTINGYRGKALKKIGARNDVEGTRVAIQHGLIDANSEWH